MADRVAAPAHSRARDRGDDLAAHTIRRVFSRRGRGGVRRAGGGGPWPLPRAAGPPDRGTLHPRGVRGGVGGGPPPAWGASVPSRGTRVRGGPRSAVAVLHAGAR